MLLIVLAYWLLTGTLPGRENGPGSENGHPGTPIAAAPATVIATAASTAAAPSHAASDETMLSELPADATAVAPTTTVATEEGVVEVAVSPDEASSDRQQRNITPTVESAPPTTTPTVIPTVTSTPSPLPTATLPPQPAATPTNPPRAGPPGMPTISYNELPREAIETIVLIGEGGPFPFDRDGIAFQNRERLLPTKPRGYYAEYTVITPGASTRGARRIIAGEEGELYYTDDHYASFYWVILP